jgi:hypothetical protein
MVERHIIVGLDIRYQRLPSPIDLTRFDLSVIYQAVSMLSLSPVSYFPRAPICNQIVACA